MRCRARVKPARGPDGKFCAQNKRGFGSLTDAERQVVFLACQGHYDKNIAALLGVERSTVRQYLASIFKKLGVQGKPEMAFLCGLYVASRTPTQVRLAWVGDLMDSFGQ